MVIGKSFRRQNISYGGANWSLLSSVFGAASLVAALPAVNIEARGACGPFAPAGFCPAFPSPTTTASSTGPSATPSTCTNPSIRKEWRTFSKDQKKAFLSAVKVGLSPFSSYRECSFVMFCHSVLVASLITGISSRATLVLIFPI